MPSASSIQPKLIADATHKPKTNGSLGILVVGVGGANGTTLVAGILANRNAVHWHGARGETMSPNYNGCITQIERVGVGYKNRVRGLADVSMAAVGGWDVRPEELGDALFRAQILDYDLTRQVRDEMNKIKVFRGYYNPLFIGPSQHKSATHILTPQEAPNASEALKTIRADIRYFKWRNGVVGHTTVVWSASVEPNSPLCAEGAGLDTAKQLSRSIEMSDEERGAPLPPSLIYATAAVLEGCSFVNGGSQNTICSGLAELARHQRGVYCLGTDFKAGQTKFKTAAVEYIRTIGLVPKVIASSNHLGNNDMKNLATGEEARMAKLRVKHDIFAPWEEHDLDHKVCIMYTPFINDEKRDFVEYTSLGFLGQTHTMVTYTRASDSVLCVPLIIDAAVWCDFFSHRSWNYDDVAKALAYLFKIPEGAAKGVDPGFFRQMDELNTQVFAACQATAARKRESTGGKRLKVRIRPEEKSTEWAIPNDSSIICAGLACVDMQLNHATFGRGAECIETFEGETSMAGGSVSMACKTLARLCHGAPLDQENYMQITPPVVSHVIPLCKVGEDDIGKKLVSLLEQTGAACRNVVTKHLKRGISRSVGARTALAVLPIYQDGRRGCFFDAASNATFLASDMIHMLDDVMTNTSSNILTASSSFDSRIDESLNEIRITDSSGPSPGAFLFGYPHLLPMMQGESLARIFSKARAGMENGGIIALDLNGVPPSLTAANGRVMRRASDLKSDAVLGPALSNIDILHMNKEELVNLTGVDLGTNNDDEEYNESAMAFAISLFLKCGVAVVAVTKGKRGCIIQCGDSDRFSRSKMLPSSWVDCSLQVEATHLPPGTRINSNGAGDAFTSGLLVAAMLRHTGMAVQTRSTPFRSQSPPPPDGDDNDALDVSLELHQLSSFISPSRKRSTTTSTTPYKLYMKENYVALKAACKDDKKEIFLKCHEMWENESEEVKEMYERKCNEEMMDDADESGKFAATVPATTTATPDNITLPNDTSFNTSFGSGEGLDCNRHLANRSLNLESAAQFACLVAANHVNMETRDLDHLDVCTLLERSMIYMHGLEEI